MSLIKVILLLGIFLFCSNHSPAQSYTRCKKPPGGQVTCEGNQAAACYIFDGSVDAHCININEEAVSSESKFKFFVFYHILNPGFRSTSEPSIDIAPMLSREAMEVMGK